MELLLNIVIYLPVIGIVAVLLAKSDEAVKWISLAVTSAAFFLSLPLMFGFDIANSSVPQYLTEGTAVFSGMDAWPTHVHVMHGLGLIMAVLFLAVFFLPFRQLRKAVDAQDWEHGSRALANVRRLVALNLVIGVIVVVVASGGRFGMLG